MLLGFFARLDRILRQRAAAGIDGDAARGFFRKMESVIVFFADNVQNVFRFRDDVGADAVARYRNNVKVHLFLLIF